MTETYHPIYYKIEKDRIIAKLFPASKNILKRKLTDVKMDNPIYKVPGYSIIKNNPFIHIRMQVFFCTLTFRQIMMNKNIIFIIFWKNISECLFQASVFLNLYHFNQP